MTRLISFFFRSMIIIPIIFSSCKKVDKLSDITTLESFEILSISPLSMVEKPVIDNNDIIIPIAANNKTFPLMISAKVISPDAVKILGDINDPMVFKTAFETKKFFLISESGIPATYTIKISVINSDANITYFSTKEGYPAEINREGAEVFVNIGSAKLPVRISPIIKLSEGASAKIPEALIFNNFYEEKIILVKSTKTQYTREWKIKLNTQIPNSELEMWIEEGKDNKYFNIDPYPGKGKGWCTANNSFVQGVFPVNHNGGKAAEIKTGTQSILGNELITAGSLFTGYFEMGFNFSDPKSMTFFGVPCKFKPKSVSIEVKYKPGPTLKKSVKNSLGTYTITDVAGVDQGNIWIEIINWSKTGPIVYHGKPTSGITILGRGETILSESGFKHISIPINYTNQELDATHIAIVMTSSLSGDIFLGAPGSSLTVDNIRLIY